MVDVAALALAFLATHRDFYSSGALIGLTIPTLTTFLRSPADLVRDGRYRRARLIWPSQPHGTHPLSAFGVTLQMWQAKWSLGCERMKSATVSSGIGMVFDFKLNVPNTDS
jgi:hypothetical protein